MEVIKTFKHDPYTQLLDKWQENVEKFEEEKGGNIDTLRRYYTIRGKEHPFFNLARGISKYLWKRYHKEEKIRPDEAIYVHFSGRWEHHIPMVREMIENLKKAGYKDEEAKEIAYCYLLGHLISHNGARVGGKRISNDDKDKMLKWVAGTLMRFYGVVFSGYEKEPNEVRLRRVYS